MAALSSELLRLCTEPILAKIIISRIQSWRTGSLPETFTTLPTQYLQTLEKQDAQGWQNFFMGLPSTGWHSIQNAHYQRLGLQHSGKRWLTAFIRKQWAIAWDIWQYRNSIVHDKMEGIEIQEVNDAIVHEYQQEQSSPDIKQYFKIPVHTRLRASFDHKKSWLHNVQIVRARQQCRNLTLTQLRTTMANWLATANHQP
jgi:hypothetical protein